MSVFDRELTGYRYASTNHGDTIQQVAFRELGDASRWAELVWINDLLPPGSPVDRLVLVEVYTPGGNWSSYPPHKHDVHATDGDGHLLEADLQLKSSYQKPRLVLELLLIRLQFTL